MAELAAGEPLWAGIIDDGGAIVLDGYHQSAPASRPDPAEGVYGPMKRMVDVHALTAPR